MNWQKTIPKTIKIGCRRYSITLMDHWEETDKMVFGRCDNNRGRIEMGEHIDAAKATETLLHELIHAIYFTYDIDNKATEEEVSSLVSTGLATIFCDNLKLLDWIKSGLTGIK